MGYTGEKSKQGEKVGGIMAQNTRMDENIYPCEEVPVKELDEIVFDLSINLQPNMGMLKRGTCNIDSK